MGFTLWGDYDANQRTAHSKYKRYMNVAGTGHDYYGPECAAPVNLNDAITSRRTHTSVFSHGGAFKGIHCDKTTGAILTSTPYAPSTKVCVGFAGEFVKHLESDTCERRTTCTGAAYTCQVRREWDDLQNRFPFEYVFASATSAAAGYFSTQAFSRPPMKRPMDSATVVCSVQPAARSP